MKKLLIFLVLLLSFSSQAIASVFDDYVNGSYKNAIKDWTKLGHNGNLPAQKYLGEVFSKGIRVSKDINKAKEWYFLAASKGDEESQFELGKLFEYHRPYNFSVAVNQYIKAGSQGNIGAQLRAGYLYSKGGNGLAIDLKKSKIWYQQAASYGNAEGQYNLALLHEEEGDCYEPFPLYNKSADQNYAPAQYRLGQMLEFGICAAVNYDMAKFFYKKAADQSSLPAKIALDQLIFKEKEEEQIKQEKLIEKLLIAGGVILSFLFLLYIRHLFTRGAKREERHRINNLKQIAQREKAEEEEKEEEEKLRLQELAKQAERDRIYALQQKKLVYLKADKYLAEFESHLPFHLSAGYSDLRIIYDEKSSLTQVSLSENQTSFKDGKLWEMLISLLVSDHPLDTMSTIYFAKIRSLLDDENYLVIGETSLEINEFFDRSTQLELVDLISTSLMPKPIALFVVLFLSREFRYPNEEERAESEFKLLHFIIKENSKVKVQKLFTKLDEYATQCVDSYADVSSKEYDQLESNQEAYIKEDEVEEESEEGYEVDEEAIEKAVKNTKLPKS